MEISINIKSGAVVVEVHGDDCYVYTDTDDGIMIDTVVGDEMWFAAANFRGIDGLAAVVSEQIAALIRRV